MCCQQPKARLSTKPNPPKMFPPLSTGELTLCLSVAHFVKVIPDGYWQLKGQPIQLKRPSAGDVSTMIIEGWCQISLAPDGAKLIWHYPSITMVKPSPASVTQSSDDTSKIGEVRPYAWMVNPQQQAHHTEPVHRSKL